VKRIKTGIVIGLETLCELTRHRWCNTLAGSSARLDERWGLGVWPSIVCAEIEESE